MAKAGTTHGDHYVNGSLFVTGNVTVSNDSILNDAILELPATKMAHKMSAPYAQGSAVTAADAEEVVYLVTGTTGTIQSFKAGSVAVCVGDSTVTVDLHKNGASVLTSVITLDSSNTVYIAEAATITTAAIEDGDVLEVVVDATVGTGTLATGVFANVDMFEDAD